MVDPLTAERILVGGERYTFLTTPMAAGGVPWFLHEGNELVPNAALMATPVRVPVLFNPSPPGDEEDEDYDPFIQRRNLTLQLNPQATAAVMRAMLGEGPPSLAREGLRTLDTFYADHARTIRFGGLELVFAAPAGQGQDENAEIGIEGGAAGNANANGAELNHYNAILADDPLHLPFSNYWRNEGADDQCVDRWMGVDLSAIPWARNGWVTISEHAKMADVPHRIVDLLGGVMAAWEPEGREKEVRYGLVYGGHMYELQGPMPKLIRAPDTERYTSFSTDVEPVLQATRSIKYRRNDTYFIGGEGGGVMRRAGDVEWEDWMAELLHAMPLCRGWDPHAMEVIRRSARSLYYSCGSIRENDNPGDYLAMDVSKCYFNALFKTVAGKETPLRPLGYEPDVDVGDPTMYDRWVDCSPTKTFFFSSSYVEVKEDLGRWGIKTNVIQGRMFNLLHMNGVQVTPVRVLDFRLTDPWRNDTTTPKTGGTFKRSKAKVRELLNSIVDTPERQKKYALVNGMMGKVSREDELVFELHSDLVDEKAWYKKTYPGIQEIGHSMRLVTDAGGFVNRLHWHAHIVHYASYLVLAQAFRVRRKLGSPEPVRIKVDMLMYRRKDCQTPWDRDGSEAIQRWFNEDPDLRWKPETVNVRLRQAVPELLRIDVEEPPVYRYKNITYTGPPGSGKTHLVMHDHHFDYAVCYSNMGVRRLARTVGEERCRTVHALFKLWGTNRGAALEDVRNMTVFVDEAQACGSALWGFFREAYHKVNARFIFAMDPDQIRPVHEERFDYDMNHPFLGEVHRLTTDYRNDAEVRYWRDKILTDELAVRLQLDGPPVVFGPETFEVVNICAVGDGGANTKKKGEGTRTLVNKRVAEYLGVEWHKSGRYRVKEPNRSLGLVKQQRLVCEGDVGFGDYLQVSEYRDEDSGKLYRLNAKQAKAHLRWGYCTTIHSMVGETIKAPTKVAVWDWDHTMFSKWLKYTAITRVESFSQLKIMTWPQQLKPAWQRALARASPLGHPPRPLTTTTSPRPSGP